MDPDTLGLHVHGFNEELVICKVDHCLSRFRAPMKFKSPKKRAKDKIGKLKLNPALKSRSNLTRVRCSRVCFSVCTISLTSSAISVQDTSSRCHRKACKE